MLGEIISTTRCFTLVAIAWRGIARDEVRELLPIVSVVRWFTLVNTTWCGAATLAPLGHERVPRLLGFMVVAHHLTMRVMISEFAKDLIFEQG